MARIYPRTLNDFYTAVQMNCTPQTHLAVTDRATYVILVPIVTSQHRHYIVLQDVTEEEVTKALEWLQAHGYKVIEGRVELQER